MKNIIRKEAIINAEGDHNNGNCKMVVCVTNGKKFHSVTDAANYAGCHITTMCGHLNGKWNTCKGKKYRYANDGAALVEELTTNIQSLTEDARLWREYQAGLEAERKAEEQRLADIEKAEKDIEYYEELRVKFYEKFMDAANKRDEARSKLAELRGE